MALTIDFCFWSLTKGTYIAYSLRQIFESILLSLIGLFVVIGITTTDQTARISYAVISLQIVFGFCFEIYIRNRSKILDGIETIFRPINSGLAMRKVIPYSVKIHTFEMLKLIFFDLIKMGAAIYCITVLARLDGLETNQGDLAVNYILLSLVIICCLISIPIYIFTIILIHIYPEFFKKWLTWLSDWYLMETAQCDIEETGNKLVMIMSEMKITGED